MSSSLNGVTRHEDFLFTCALLAGIAGINTHANTQNYPWCARCAKGGDTENCGFTTFDQCMADVSGSPA